MRKIISLILSSFSIFSSSICNNTFASETYQKTAEKESKYRINKNASKKMSKKEKIAFISKMSAFFATGIPVGYLSYIGIETLDYKSQKREIADSLKKRFYAVPANYMQKKNGIHWCWLECIRALYKYRNIDISPEALYKKLTGKSPEFFTVNRRTGASDSALFNMKFSEVDTKYKPIFANIDIKRYNGVKALLEYIKKFYNYIGKVPFYIGDSDEASKGGGHAVNITKILDDSFCIEEPDTGLSFFRDSIDYCSNYFQAPYYASKDKINLHMMALVPKEESIKSVFIKNNEVRELIELKDEGTILSKRLDDENLKRFNS